MFVGQMGCEVLNFALKRLIKEERPKRNDIPPMPRVVTLPYFTMLIRLLWVEMYGKGYGMPSSHAQFVTFFSLSLTLFLLFRHTPTPSPSHTPITIVQRALLSFLALFCAGGVCVSRIYLNYHTGKQVLVGCGAGAFSAIAWFLLIMWTRRNGLVAWCLDLKWASMLRIRDLVVEEDLAEAGWEKWEERRRRRKMGNINGKLSKKTR